MKHKTILIWLFVLISIFGCRIRKTETTGKHENQNPTVPPYEAKAQMGPGDLLEWHPPLAPDVFYLSMDRGTASLSTLPEIKPARPVTPPVFMQPLVTGSIVPVIYPGTLIPFSPAPRSVEFITEFDLPEVSEDRLFSAHFSNDAMLSMDYYYTNGVRFEYIDPGLARSPFGYFMLPYRQNSVNYHGISLVQDFYTPLVLDTTAVQYGDRPFAGVLYAGQFKVTLNPAKNYKQVSEVNLGIIGPESLGGFVQTTIHETKPTGWVNQVRNDVVFNYNIRIEKGIINNNHFDLNSVLEGKMGTLFTNAGAGFYSRIGSFMPYFENIGIKGPGKNGYTGHSKLQYALTFSSIVRAVAYDATLQGGLFSRNNIYTLAPEEINRLVFNASFGIEFTYKFFGFRTEMNYITPEFKAGKEHRWLHMAATFSF
jgi:hypothetical protein